MVKNGTTLTYYVDGVATGSSTDTNNYTRKPGTWNKILFFKDDGGEQSSGSVSRIRMFNDTLTPTEVAALAW